MRYSEGEAPQFRAKKREKYQSDRKPVSRAISATGIPLEHSRFLA